MPLVEIVQRAADAAGGVQALASKIGLRHMESLYNWRQVPDRWVRKVHDVTGIPLSELRSDLYGDAPNDPSPNL